MQSNSNVPEEWRPVVGFEEKYEVSSHCRVRSIDGRIVVSSNGMRRKLKGVMLKLRPNELGYLRVAMSARGADRGVHKLVAEAFIGPCPTGKVVCHNDGNQQNNHVDNLRYDTRGNNNRDAVRHGTHYQGRKTHCPRNHPLEGANLTPNILKKGRRSCLACNRTHNYVRTRPDLKDQFKEISDSYYLSVVSEN